MMDDTSSVRIEIVDPDAEGGTGGDAPGCGGIDALLRRAAGRAPSRLAYADPPNRGAFSLGDAKRVSFAEADDIASRVATRLVQAGLQPGDRIAIRLPNIIELPLMLAGAWRAGLVPVCLPLLWRSDELHRTLPQINPAAIVTVGHFGAHNHSETMREAATQDIAVRHVFGIGGDLADGVAAIDGWFSPDAQGAALDSDDEPADLSERPAAMTWDSGKGGVFPVPRTHSELRALGRMAASAFEIDGKDVLLCTYPMTSIASLAAQMIAALDACATLVLHQPFSYDTFIAQLRDFGVTFTAVPGTVFAALRERGDLDEGDTSLKKVARVWPWPHQPSPSPDATNGALAVFEMRNIGELAMVIEAAPAATGLPLGKLKPRNDEAGSTEPYLETRVRGSVSDGPRRQLSGALLLRGSTVPAGPFDYAGAVAEECLRPDAQGYVNTGLHCTVDEASAGRFECARQHSIIYHGGVAFGADELDAAYASFPDLLDAAVLPVEDALMGERILAAVVPSPGKTPSLHNFRTFLTGKGLAAYKFPEQIVVVRSIPRDAEGKVLRAEILSQV